MLFTSDKSSVLQDKNVYRLPHPMIVNFSVIHFSVKKLLDDRKMEDRKMFAVCPIPSSLIFPSFIFLSKGF
jgi:hypothetical protein